MQGPISRVNPGDLIQAAYFNLLADTVNDLLVRVAKLEGNQTPATGVTLKPLSGSVHIGDAIIVEGTNFEVPARFNTVTLGSAPITEFNPGCDDSHLAFNVPPLSNPGRDFPFTVTNKNGTATINITVLPTGNPVPSGNLVITPQAVAPGTIQVGNIYNFSFVVDSQTNIPETYRLAAVFDAAQGATADAWRASMQIVNATGSQVDSILVSPQGPVTVQVKVTVPVGAVSVNLSLRAFSVNAPNDPKLNNVSTPVSLVIGQATQVSDPRTTFGQLVVAPPSDLVTDPNPQIGRVIRVAVGQKALIRVTAQFTIAGDYTYSTKVVPDDATKWKATPLVPANGKSSETAGSSEDVAVELDGLAADAGTTRALEIHAVRTGPGNETFDSWFSINIQSA